MTESSNYLYHVDTMQIYNATVDDLAKWKQEIEESDSSTDLEDILEAISDELMARGVL